MNNLQNKKKLCETIAETIRSITELPEDFNYDYPLFDQFDGRDHLALSSIKALELVVLIYEKWGVDVPMEDIRRLTSVNAIAEYLEAAVGGMQQDGGRD